MSELDLEERIRLLALDFARATQTDTGGQSELYRHLAGLLHEATPEQVESVLIRLAGTVTAQMRLLDELAESHAQYLPRTFRCVCGSDHELLDDTDVWSEDHHIVGRTQCLLDAGLITQEQVAATVMLEGGS